MEKRTIVYILTIIILLVAISIFISIKLTPKTNNYKTYVVSGKVLPSKDFVNQRQPKYVYVYYPFHLPNYLCRGNEFQLSIINWIDEKEGKFEIYFTVPEKMSKIILTVDCSTCDYKEINLNEIPESIDIPWGSAKCEESYEISDKKDEIIDHARNMFNYIEKEIVEKPFNESEKQSVKEDIRLGRDAIFDSESSKEEDESLSKAYESQWLGWKAEYKMTLFELRYCIDKVDTLFNTYKDKNCFIPDYTSYRSFISANESYNSRKDDRTLNENSPGTNNITELERKIKNLHRDFDWTKDSLYECEDAFQTLNATFTYQEPYCDARTVVSWSIYTLLIILGFFAGILYKKITIKWTKQT